MMKAAKKAIGTAEIAIAAGDFATARRVLIDEVPFAEEITTFVRALADSDRIGCKQAGTEFDAEWTGEHTTALADEMGHKPSPESVAFARAEYQRWARLHDTRGEGEHG